jgi:hypothetical protein
VWWSTPVILAARRQRQEVLEFKVRFDHPKQMSQKYWRRERERGEREREKEILKSILKTHGD